MDDGIRRAHKARRAKGARRPRTTLALGLLALAGTVAACSSIVPTPAPTSRVTPSPSPPATVAPSPTIAGVPLPAMPASLIGAPCADVGTEGTLEVDPVDPTMWWVFAHIRHNLVWPPGSIATPDGVIHGPDGSILMRAGDRVTGLCVITAGELYYAVQWPPRS